MVHGVYYGELFICKRNATINYLNGAEKVTVHGSTTREQ
jgi:hypothetical protein